MERRIERFGVTYEGLKLSRYYLFHSVYLRFGVTYEGLKHSYRLDWPTNHQEVLELPMRV
mgnify:FL=1